MPKRRKFDDGGDTEGDQPIKRAGTASIVSQGSAGDPANDFGAPPASGIDFGIPGMPDPRSWWQKNRTKVYQAAGNLAPFASNVANAFRTPPSPMFPQLARPVTLSRISLASTRQNIVNASHAADVQADKGLDEQSAAAVRTKNLAGRLNSEGQVNEQEAFLNARQRAEATGMNMNVDMHNTGTVNAYQEQLLERQIAGQREQSQNLSNASDKQVAIANEHAKAQLDMDKLTTLSELWKKSGVYGRLRNDYRKEGVDPTGLDKYDTTIKDESTHEAMGGYIGHKVYAEGGDTNGPGGNTLGRGLYQGQTADNDSLNLLDHLSTIIGRGGSAMGTPESKALGADPLGQKLLTSAIMFNSSPDYKTMSPEDRVSRYFSTVSSDPDVHAYKEKWGQYAGTEMRNTPDTTTHSIVGRAFGGYTQKAGTGYLNPFGSNRNMGLGPAIPGDKVRTRGLRLSSSILKAGGWIAKAVNPAHKGYCTPMTKSTCTPRRKAFAMTMKKHHGFH